MKELVAKKSSEIIISSASKAWKYVHGLVNVYKPAGVKTVHVINSIKTNICKGNCFHSIQLKKETIKMLMYI